MSLLLLITLAFPSFGMDVKSLAQEIKSRACESLLLGPRGFSVHEILFVIGLGNHGYTGTRHNAGVDLITHLEQGVRSETREASEHWLEFEAATEEEAEEYVRFSGASSPWRQGLTVHYRVGGRIALPDPSSKFAQIVFVYPQFDINESGHFVAALAAELNLSLRQLLVVVDDLTLPRNQLILTPGRIDGNGDGHNGLKSLNAELTSGGYMRLRVGVSSPKAEGQDISRYDWVLGRMPDQDREVLFAPERLQRLGEVIVKLKQRLAPGARESQLMGEVHRDLRNLNSPLR